MTTGGKAWDARAWFLVIMVSLMHGLNHAFYVMMAPLFVPMQEHFGFARLSPALAVGTAFLLPYGLSHILFGSLSDRFSKSAIMGYGGLAASMLLVAAGLADSYHAMFTCVAAAGVCAASYHGVSAAFLTILFPDAKGKGLGISGIGATIGLAAAPAISGIICRNWSWQASFVTFGIAGTVFSLFFLLTVREPARAAAPSGASTGLAKALWLLLPLMIFMMLREFCGWGSFSLVPTWAQKIGGYAVDKAGRLSMCVTLAGLVAGPLFGMLSDKVNRRKVLVPLVACAAALIAALPYLPGAWLFPATLTFGFFYTATIPVLDAWVGDMTPDSLKGSLFGIAVTAGIGVGSLAPVAAAVVADSLGGSSAGFNAAFVMLAAAMAVSLVPLLLSPSKRIANQH